MLESKGRAQLVWRGRDLHSWTRCEALGGENDLLVLLVVAGHQFTFYRGCRSLIVVGAAGLKEQKKNE